MTGICGHLNVPTMASLTPKRNVYTFARLHKMLQYHYQHLRLSLSTSTPNTLSHTTP